MCFLCFNRIAKGFPKPPFAMITALAQSRNAEVLIAASVREQPELHVCLRYLLPRHATLSTQIRKISSGIASGITLKEP